MWSEEANVRLSTLTSKQKLYVLLFNNWLKYIIIFCRKGAPMIFPIPGCVPMKPGSATLPFFGILPVILNDDGKELSGPNTGFLAFKVIIQLLQWNQLIIKLLSLFRMPGLLLPGLSMEITNDLKRLISLNFRNIISLEMVWHLL